MTSHENDPLSTKSPLNSYNFVKERYFKLENIYLTADNITGKPYLCIVKDLKFQFFKSTQTL